jgi:hypothetical protein
MSENENVLFGLGASVGRGQAFGLVANHCSAAHARCLQQLRESDDYKRLRMTWAEFCQEHIGLTRQRVDQLIQNLDEFGDTYFNLSRIVPVSPDAYRQIAGKIEGEEIEINGEKVAIVPENAPRIRAAVNHMRGQLKSGPPTRTGRKSPDMDTLAARTLGNFEGFRRIIQSPLSADEQTRLRDLLRDLAGKIGQLHRELNQK